MPAVTAAGAVGDIVLERVAGDMIARLVDGYTRRRASDDDGQLALPVHLRASRRQPDRVAVADHRTDHFRKHVRVVPRVARPARPDALDARLGRRRRLRGAR